MLDKFAFKLQMTHEKPNARTQNEIVFHLSLSVRSKCCVTRQHAARVQYLRLMKVAFSEFINRLKEEKAAG